MQYLMNLYCKYQKKIVVLESKRNVQTKRGRKITPGKIITSLSDDENDAPGSSKKQKGSKKKKTENKNIWQCSDCADEWDEDGDMTNG